MATPRPGGRSVSLAVYRLLLQSYPRRFRQEYGREMALAFRDACREERRARGMLDLWRRTAADLAQSAYLEHKTVWRQTMYDNRSLWASLALLVVPALFLLMVFTDQVLGVAALANAFDSMYLPAKAGGWHIVLDIFIVLGPAAAVLLNLPALFGVQVATDGDALLSLTLKRAHVVRFVIVGVCLVMAAIFGTYLLFENGPCIFGQQLSC